MQLGVDRLRDPEHFLAHGGVLALRAPADLPPVERRIQRVAEFPVEQRRAEAKVALRRRNEIVLQPRLVRGKRLPRRRNRRLQPLGKRRRHLAEPRHDHGLDDGVDAPVLGKRGLRVHLRDARRFERPADLAEKTRKLLQA